MKVFVPMSFCSCMEEIFTTTRLSEHSLVVNRSPILRRIVKIHIISAAIVDYTLNALCYINATSGLFQTLAFDVLLNIHVEQCVRMFVLLELEDLTSQLTG